jgi:hypothetical protein
MRYSLEKVSTPQACDALLTPAHVRKQRLERRRRNLGEAIDIFSRRLDRVIRDSAQVRSSLEAFRATYEALPEGRDRASIKVKIKRLELRQAVLEKKAYTYNAGALLAREMKYNRLDNQVITLEGYIASVIRRSTALIGVASRAGHVAAVLRPPVVRQGVLPAGLNVADSLQIVDNPTYLPDQRQGHVYFIALMGINLSAVTP